MEVLNELAQYWEVVFLYIFKYLKDIDNKLDLLHTDNAVKDNKITNLERDITELKGWIKRIEDKVDNFHKGN